MSFTEIKSGMPIVSIDSIIRFLENINQIYHYDKPSVIKDVVTVKIAVDVNQIIDIAMMKLNLLNIGKAPKFIRILFKAFDIEGISANLRSFKKFDYFLADLISRDKKQSTVFKWFSLINDNPFLFARTLPRSYKCAIESMHNANIIPKSITDIHDFLNVRELYRIGDPYMMFQFLFVKDVYCHLKSSSFCYSNNDFINSMSCEDKLDVFRCFVRYSNNPDVFIITLTSQSATENKIMMQRLDAEDKFLSINENIEIIKKCAHYIAECIYNLNYNIFARYMKFLCKDDYLESKIFSTILEYVRTDPLIVNSKNFITYKLN